jgi:hypothetical protein
MYYVVYVLNSESKINVFNSLDKAEKFMNDFLEQINDDSYIDYLIEGTLYQVEVTKKLSLSEFGI